VGNALKGHNIDRPDAYLDKVVQTRLSLPLIQEEDLLRLINREFDALPKDATKEHFSAQQERVSSIYYSGLRHLLETPRDIKRLFNRLRFVEPGCRGEVNIADLLGLETIAIKAPSVYELLKRAPEAYLGQEVGTTIVLKDPKETIQQYKADREAARETGKSTESFA
jgi:predicted KAP-like P-loop ATPase